MNKVNWAEEEGEFFGFAELIKETDDGWRKFWKERGIILKKQDGRKKWYGYDVFGSMLSPDKMISRAIARKKRKELSK